MNSSFSDRLNLPVIAAPMFLISGPALVIECCKNGVVGSFPSLNQRTTEGFEQWVVEIKEALQQFERETGKKAAPFGVNLIVNPTNERLRPDIAICVKHKVPLVITSLGAVPQLVDAIHSYGGQVYHDIIKKRHAEKASQAGVDGLILVAGGAGGHAGAAHPIPLIHEIRKFFHKTLILSGCLSTGNDIAAALQMGADLAYMGTRFINVEESLAEEKYKQMIIDSSIDDIVYTAAVSGVRGSFLRQSLEAAGITEEMWKADKKATFSASDNEMKAWKTVWSAGQGVTAIEDVIPVKTLIDRLKKEFIEALKKQQQLLKQYGNRFK